LNVLTEVEKVKESRKLRRGAGKARNRRYVQRRGPLVVYSGDNVNIARAFRNIAGVEVCNVSRLNLLQLAPGGHLGRFVIWTEDAFNSLDKIFGTHTKESEVKKGFVLPRAKMTNADLSRIINSDEVQSKLRAKQKNNRTTLKKNPLKNLGAMVKLNPYALTQRRRAILAAEKSQQHRRVKVQRSRTSDRFLNGILLAPQAFIVEEQKVHEVFDEEPTTKPSKTTDVDPEDAETTAV